MAKDYTAYRKAYYLANKERVDAKNREAWNRLSKAEKTQRSLLNRLRSKYRLTLEQYLAMQGSQGGVCAICKTEPKTWFIDHCHSTGKVRALLCMQCNTGIGMLRDNPELMESAASYIRRHR